MSGSTFPSQKIEGLKRGTQKKITISQHFPTKKKNESSPPFLFWLVDFGDFLPLVPPPTRPGGAFCCLIELHKLLLLLLPHKSLRIFQHTLEHTPDPQLTVYEGFPFIWGFRDGWGMLQGYVGVFLEKEFVFGAYYC